MRKRRPIYWLELLKATDYINEQEFESLNNEAIELLKMRRSSIITSKQNNSYIKTYNYERNYFCHTINPH